jgi:hypothetical protein
MRKASTITVAEDGQTKQFTAAEFGKVMNASHFVGAVAFWRALERLANPDPHTRFHAMGVLQELARMAFADCGGVAVSPQEAECFAYCGYRSVEIRSPGELARRRTDP